MTTVPATDQEQEDTLDHLVIDPTFVASNGAVYVHKDLVEVRRPWEDQEYLETHIPPVKVSEPFGDVESFAEYLKRYSAMAKDAKRTALVTWNAKGLRATLDYHEADAPARAAWQASYPFITTPEWRAWTGLMAGAVTHAKFVEFLEDHFDDIDTPDKTQLLNLLRNLRGLSNAEVETTVRPDGTSKVESKTDRSVNAELPEEIRIAIPILWGHTKWVTPEEGAPYEAPVVHELTVRIRVTVDPSAHLTFRFAMPYAERALEKVYAERVAKAKELLGDDFIVLRAAD